MEAVAPDLQPGVEKFFAAPADPLTPQNVENRLPILDAIDRRDTLEVFESTYRFDELNTAAVYNQLTKVGLRILDVLRCVQSWGYRERPGMAPLIQPRQEWIADLLGVTRQCVNVNLAQLDRLGLIDKITRRKANGRWQTCLYHLIAPADWLHQRYVNGIRTLRRVKARAQYRKRQAAELVQRARDQADADKRRRIAEWTAAGGPLGPDGHRVLYGGLISDSDDSSFKNAVRVPDPGPIKT